MRKRKLFSRALVYACMIVALLAIPVPAEASLFVVNSADDVDDGSCDAEHCSLREAINAANTNPGADSIKFDIPGPGPHVIMLTDYLTIRDDETYIDGSSQPGYSGSPIIVLDGGNTVCRGLVIHSNDNTVVGLSFVRFRCSELSAAIHIWGGALGGGERNLIKNNFIGIDASGSPAGNKCGVMFWDRENIVRGNVISGNRWGIIADTSSQIIEDNRIGTGPNGMATSPGYMNLIGILLRAGSDGTRVGGADPLERNLISGNGTGIVIESEENKVLGNFIGTNLDGNAALPNITGIIVHGDENQIGGRNPGEGNLISGNQGEGLLLLSSWNEVFGNKIGTDRIGVSSVQNFFGISVFGEDNVIGGSVPGEGNLISGNAQGILLNSSALNNRVIGNKIGTSIHGTSPLGNGWGIVMVLGAHGNVVGGLDPNEGNLIAFSTNSGIRIIGNSSENSILGNTIHTNGTGMHFSGAGIRNRISRNSIYGNNALGIDLETPGVTPNDPGDADWGANDLLNFPEITSAGTTGVSGTACAGCIVELFISDQDPSGHGEGQTFIDAATADASGSFAIPASFPITSCTRVTATATDASGNTSEFSENHVVGFCMITQMPWAIMIAFALIGGGALGGLYAGRSSGRSQGTTAAIGAGFGVILTAVLVLLAAVLPFVEIVLPQSSEAPQPGMDMCEQYLDPAGFSPTDGAVFEIDEDPRLEWSATGPLPEGQIRWRVDLLGHENLELSQWTSDSNLLFSTFGHSPLPGTRYLWRVALRSSVHPPSGDPSDWVPCLIWKGHRRCASIQQSGTRPAGQATMWIRPRLPFSNMARAPSSSH